MDTESEFVQIDTGDAPQYCVIWLHGLGADGYDFVPIVKELEAQGIRSVRYIFPHAPKIPVSINGGYVMRAWYDIKNVDLQRLEDEGGIRASGKYVLDLINRQVKAGFKPENIVLAGFSQGGAITYFSGLRCEHKLAGLMTLSTYMPLIETLADERKPANAQTPIFAAHGQEDPIVPCARGELAVVRLQDDSQPIEWHVYNMDHSVCAEEVRDIGQFLKSVFK